MIKQRKWNCFTLKISRFPLHFPEVDLFCRNVFSGKELRTIPGWRESLNLQSKQLLGVEKSCYTNIKYIQNLSRNCLLLDIHVENINNVKTQTGHLCRQNWAWAINVEIQTGHLCWQNLAWGINWDYKNHNTTLNTKFYRMLWIMFQRNL